jgi:hypothetical protein
MPNPILEQGVKKTVVPIVFKREALNNQTMKTTFGFFYVECQFSVWTQEPYEKWTLTKVLGSTLGKRDESGKEVGRTPKIFLYDGFMTCELDFRKEQQSGLSFKVITSEKRLTRQKALELIKSGAVKYFDSENFVSGNLYG